MNIRRLAIALASKCEAAGQYSNIALDSAIKKYGLYGADRGLLTLLTYGIIERRITLDYVIDSMSSIPPSKIERDTRDILRLGIYQLLYTDKIPDHAAINEAVELASKRSKGFVNALLREFVRRGKTVDYPDCEKDEVDYLSVKYSFPREICEVFLCDFGVDKTESLFEAFSKTADVTLRVNTIKISRDGLLALIKDKGIECEPTEYSPHGIRLSGKTPLCDIPGDDEGLWFVQDEASQICTTSADARKGDFVIDACACPGGKSFALATDMKQGEIISCDIHENKLSLIERGAQRLSIDFIKTKAQDARVLCSEFCERADVVLCDVPCSGFGVFAKKPDIRYKSVADTERLPEIQRAILYNCSKYVKAGGTLVYSTCTLLKRENEENVRLFLSENPQFEAVDFGAGGIESKDGMLTLYPDIHGTDGFFVAKMKRIK